MSHIFHASFLSDSLSFIPLLHPHLSSHFCFSMYTFFSFHTMLLLCSLISLFKSIQYLALLCFLTCFRQSSPATELYCASSIAFVVLHAHACILNNSFLLCLLTRSYLEYRKMWNTPVYHRSLCESSLVGSFREYLNGHDRFAGPWGEVSHV